MSFNLLAPHYRWMEAVLAGRRLQRARTAWLEELRGRRRILSAGEGHGRFATACAARFPEAEITCLDSSVKMLNQAKRQTAQVRTRIHWHCADVLDWRPEGEFDAIVTCFFLDCFPPATLASVVARLADWAAPNAIWLMTDFALPPHGLSRVRARAIHQMMYRFFRITTALPARRLTPPDELIRAHGFHRIGRQESEWGLLHADLWQRG